MKEYMKNNISDYIEFNRTFEFIKKLLKYIFKLY